MAKKDTSVDLVWIDDFKREKVVDCYFRWKELNFRLSDFATRGLNMPDSISEPIACYCLGLYWNRGVMGGDATDKTQSLKIEMKATSRYCGDLSSFSPSSYFDELVFINFNLDEDIVDIYHFKISSDVFYDAPVNTRETMRDQANAGKRPRLSIYQQIIEPNGIIPDVSFDLRKQIIIDNNRR